MVQWVVKPDDLSSTHIKMEGEKRFQKVASDLQVHPWHSYMHMHMYTYIA